MKTIILAVLLLAMPAWAGMDYRPADTGGSPTGACGGDLGGTFPNCTVVSTTLSAALPVNQGGTGTTSTLTGIVRGSATSMTAAELSGDAVTSGSNAVTVSKINNVTVGRNYMAAFSTGVLSALPSASSEYNCFKAQTNDTVLNGVVAFDGSTLTCVSGPTVALQDCGVSTSCSTPTTRLSAQISSGSVNTITDMTVQNSGTITAGNYYCWEVSAGTCATVTGGFSGSAVLQ